MQLKGRFIRESLLIAMLATTLLGVASESAFSGDAVIIRFSMDPAGLEGVRNSADLAEALHQGLALEATSPLNYELNIHIQGFVYQGGDEQPYPAASGVFVDIDQDNSVDGRITDLRFYTFNNFSESEAWAYFQEQIQQALMYSMNSSGAFEASGDGTVPLTVTSVLDGTEAIEPDGKSMVLKLMPETVYRDGSKFGSKQPPAGYKQEVETMQIVLAPAAAAVVAAVEEAQVAPVAEAETDGITGVYGYDQSGYRIEIKDGQHVMWDIRKSPPEYILLTPVGENHFSADLFGEPSEIKFSGDEQGHATEMFIKMPGSNGFKLPLKESTEAEQGASVTESADTPMLVTSPGGIIGTYGADRGALSIQEVDGRLAMSNPNAVEIEHWPLEEIAENRYSTVFNGNPVELRFSVDDDGHAFAVTIVQGDREMKIPRQEERES